jgi:hypothetical protein
MHTTSHGQTLDMLHNDQAPFQAAIRPLSLWMESMPRINMWYKKGVVEVCLGGVFMTTIQRIMDAPVGNWSVLIQALSQGDNIEEGHCFHAGETMDRAPCTTTRQEGRKETGG